MIEGYESFKQRCAEIVHLRSILQDLSWDQETMMPEQGATHRASQVSTLAVFQHQRLTDPAFGDVICELEAQAADLDIWGQASVREARRQYDKATKLPESLVRQLAETAALAYEAWVKARSESYFPLFAPWLAKMVALKREEARCLSSSGPLYDALLDEYEPGMTVLHLDPLFSQIRPELTRLLEQLTSAERQPKALPPGPYPVQMQETLGREILSSMGFNWKAGRLDTSPHPFCTGLSPQDVRITTRYSATAVGKALFGMIHECGHALYEQGLDPACYGLLACDAISLGLHESQSRLWENQVGRSTSFWEYWFPRLKRTFAPHFDDFSVPEFVHSINRVSATPVRVEADEVTYGLHVILRYELEKRLIGGDLDVSGVEAAWNARMHEYLGFEPSSSSEGILQDTHWSQGLFGYFPTYLLGNLYAAQLFNQAHQSIPDLDCQIGRGEMLGLRKWLGEKIHRHGKTLTAAQAIRQATGKELNPSHFLDYLQTKFTALYGV